MKDTKTDATGKTKYYATAYRIESTGSVSDPEFVKGEYPSDQTAKRELTKGAVEESRRLNDYSIEGTIYAEGDREVGRYKKVFNSNKAYEMSSMLVHDGD